MILIIDNYDSFVHNLARYIRQICDSTTTVMRNNEIDAEGVQQLAPAAIIISPGPCRPIDSGNTLQIIKHCGKHVPIFGVCLGHQAIIESFGGTIIRATKPVHGKPDQILHDGTHQLFDQIPTPFTAGRYHSLIAQPDSIPECLQVIGRNDCDIVMAVAHQTLPIMGVQFHPESILTQHGYRLLHNFLVLSGIDTKFESLEAVI